MTSIFKIVFQKDAGYKTPERFLAAANGDAQKAWTIAASNHAEGLANLLRDRMAHMLEKGGPPKVGASGGSAKNLYVEPGGMVGKSAMFNVVEGDYAGNKFIRRGFGPTKGNRVVPVSKIRLWAAQKGVQLYDPATKSVSAGKRDYATLRAQPVGRGKNPNKLYARANSGKRNVADAAINAIISKLMAHGSAESKHWKALHPVGKGRFDYPQYVIMRYNSMQSDVRKAGQDLVSAYIDYVLSGKRPGLMGSRTFSRGRRD